MRQGWFLLSLVLAAVVAFAPAGGPGSPRAADAAPATHAGGDPAPKGGGIDIWKGLIETGVWTVVVFVALLFILGRFAWKPMMQNLEDREKRISSAVEEARAIKAENERLKGEMQAEIKKANEQVRELMDEARKDAQQAREQLLADAQAKIQEERQRLLREVETAREQALADIWRQGAQLATLVSAKAIRRSLTPEDHHRLVDEALADLRGNLAGHKA